MYRCWYDARWYGVGVVVDRMPKPTYCSACFFNLLNFSQTAPTNKFTTKNEPMTTKMTKNAQVPNE